VARWRAGDQPNAVSDCRSRGDEQRMQWGVYRGRAQEQSTRWGISGQFLEKPEARREAGIGDRLPAMGPAQPKGASPVGVGKI